ncbi:Hypothetical protein R9X50_00525800 [Acrodontium crateriforme]|uniref:P/Homo B domain-containing protein n=1 Tax=Acrodontium crateriforme TaxID=150365 RepID=A0AAQ3M6T2_9PEZI|nr:Hypothetical protein R9X50_00525800 [Acrodontium crateriforme]
MRWSDWAAVFLLAAPSTSATRARDYDAHDYYAVHLSPESRPEDVSAHLGLEYDGPLGELKDHHMFRADNRHHDYDHIKSALTDLRLRRRKREMGSEEPHVLDGVLFTQKQDISKRFPLVKRNVIHRQSAPLAPDEGLVQEQQDVATKLGLADPIFMDQWHLYNHVEKGNDINVTGVWVQGITGKNSTVCIVDDGLDMDSDDLAPNYFREGSYDFNDQVNDPKPRLLDDRHGTRCAGEVAAAKNNVCGVGVAYDSRISGVRILSKAISDADEALAMNYHFQENDIYSCSWGPPDDGQSMEAPSVLIKRAMVNGVQNGRGGLGSIYVFAIGNGAASDDNCNFDGYTNSIYSVSVGGIDRKGLHPYYSEACSAQLVVTYSSGSGDAIHTTDVGKDKCYSNHGGTSAAGPLVSGIYALALEANPKLTWRDIQYITILSAVKIDQGDDWVMVKGVGKEFSHQFGYGKADAWALVEMAKTWKNVKPQAWYFSPWMHVKHAIPQGDQGLASTFTVTEAMLKKANLERLEHVTVTMNVEHGRRGDLSVELRSPDGVVSHIATHRRNDGTPQGYVDWTFMSVAHWGESGVGDWTIVVKDTNVNDFTGNFTDWRLKLWGESSDGEKQDLLPLPTETDDDDHDEVLTPIISTASVAVPSQTGSPEGNPDDHQDRPVNNKHTSTVSPTSTQVESTSIAIPKPTGTDNKEEEHSQPSEPSASPSSTTDSFLPHIFPTFGVSKTTQVWIYGTLVLIIIFLSGLGGWWYYVRSKKRKWKTTDDYGFEMVDHDDDPDDDTPGGANGSGEDGYANGGIREKRKGRRAGELYDAFAEGSDEEEPFDLGSDSEDDHTHHGESEKADMSRYRDEEPRREGRDVSP